jgi:outer membrane protein assembly factor BamB
MLASRSYIVASIALASGFVHAQFDAPAPLAWRWQQSGSSFSGGSALADGNVIYFNGGQRVYAIDRESGTQLWKYPSTTPLPGFLRRSPILVDGTLIVSTDDKKVYGIDPATGVMKWVYEAPFNISSSVVGVGKFLAFAMEGGNFIGVNAADGTAMYDSPYKVLDGIAGPIYSNGKDAILFFDSGNTLRSIGLSSKLTQWKQKFSARPADGTMTVANSSVYLYSGSFITCLNAITGSARWQNPVPETMVFAPEFGGGNVLAVSREGKCYFYDERGSLLTKKAADLSSQPFVQPTFVGKDFVVPTANGAICLLDAKSPDVKWQYFVRPMNDAAAKASVKPAGGGAAGGAGGGFGGGFGGGQGGGPGGVGGGTTTAANTPIVSLQVAARVTYSGKTLFVPANDGSILAFDTENGVDLVGPLVKPVWPPQGETVSGLLGQEFIFRVDDDASGVRPSSIKFDIDGKPYNFEFGRDGFLLVRISTTVKNATLSNGRRVMNLTVTDWLGNETKSSFTIRIDNALPIIRRDKKDAPGGSGAGGRGGLGGPGGGGAGGGFGGDGR